MDKTKMLEVARELLSRSKAGKLEWEEGPFANSYMVKFPEVRIVISREFNIYALHLVNENGNITDSLSDASIDFITVINVKELLEEIYDSARRQVLGIPSNVDKVLEYLKGE